MFFFYTIFIETFTDDKYKQKQNVLLNYVSIALSCFEQQRQKMPCVLNAYDTGDKYSMKR